MIPIHCACAHPADGAVGGSAAGVIGGHAVGVGMTHSTVAAGNPVPLRQDAAIIGMVGVAHASSHFSHLPMMGENVAHD